jgi:hypothetical protein
MRRSSRFRDCFGACVIAVLVMIVLTLSPLSIVRAQNATPTAAVENNPLAEMLRLTPNRVLDSDADTGLTATFADIQLQTDVSGIARPKSGENQAFVEWGFSLSALALPSDLAQYALDPNLPVLIGFTLLDVDQYLEVGAPPDTIRFFRGHFDHKAIDNAWTTQRYKMVDVDGTTVASLHEDNQFDMTSDLGIHFFAHFNNGAFLPDGTLVFTSTLDAMREVIATAKGEQSSLADRVDVAALLSAMKAPLASAALVSGASLQGVDSVGVLATPDALRTQIAEASAMPPITAALLGVTPGGPLSRPNYQNGTPQPDIPDAMFKIELLLSTQPEAVTAAQVVDDRLATMNSIRTNQPYSELFASWNATADPNLPIAFVDLTFSPGRFPRLWFDMLVSRDLGFLS